MLDPKTSALLVMDYQADIFAMLGDAGAPLLARAAPVIDRARSAGVTIIYIVVGFRPGYPEIHPRNTSFGAVAKAGRMVSTTPGSDIPAPVAPEPFDVVIQKHRVSAFTGTELDMVLRSKGITTLILAGIATSGVVLSTVRHANDADYEIVVVKDLCADRDDEVHRVLTEKVFARHAVITANQLAALLPGA